eukprot:TRINITY_DN384_c0_g1_i1.p2 TRINITY_DN384_c0_g1~~TRINITY_DN384_c0_g1_i1.p2  ORF type:complete len:108 (-),score=15.66 TRINITY_DN384_c0_g1_i1:13-336(-)
MINTSFPSLSCSLSLCFFPLSLSPSLSFSLCVLLLLPLLSLSTEYTGKDCEEVLLRLTSWRLWVPVAASFFVGCLITGLFVLVRSRIKKATGSEGHADGLLGAVAYQ